MPLAVGPARELSLAPLANRGVSTRTLIAMLLAVMKSLSFLVSEESVTWDTKERVYVPLSHLLGRPGPFSKKFTLFVFRNIKHGAFNLGTLKGLLVTPFLVQISPQKGS